MKILKCHRSWFFQIPFLLFAISCATLSNSSKPVGNELAVKPTNPVLRSVSSSCEYGKSKQCGENEYCVKLESSKAECRSFPNLSPPSFLLPYGNLQKVFCDQGALPEPGNSHTWQNTAFAVDLISDQLVKEVPVYSVAGGLAIIYDECKSQNDRCGNGFGNSVKILRDDGYLIFYAHLEKVFVKNGARVKTGELLGIEGTSGWAGENNRHLHFSVHYDWRKEDFEFWKGIGFLPNSVPFGFSMCGEGCSSDCRSDIIDVRNLICRRNGGTIQQLCSSNQTGIGE